MALAGLRKQINKANQYVTEKMGVAEGTKLSDEYVEMEKKTDGIIELVDELLNKTKEYLQPNPATRAKLMIGSKVQAKMHAYPQPEGTLGEVMVRTSAKLGADSIFGDSLNEMGEALKQMAEVKFALEDNVKQNFLEPLTQLQNKEVRDVLFHRKKLEGRRLDFDCKKRTKAGFATTPNDIKAAEEKFEESFNLASMGMFSLLSNETEQISQLAAFSEALYEYHSQCASILETLTSRLIQQKEAAAAKPVPEFVPRKLSELSLGGSIDNSRMTGGMMQSPQQQTNASARSPAGSPINKPPSTLNLATANENNGHSRSPNASPLPSPVRSPARSPVQRGPCCQALFDFDAENPGELGFKEGDIIVLNQKIDDNWFQGTINGKTGMFPITYVQVLVPLP